ncbi:hypothetical protein [Acinetobacter celticus]|uniref:Uncharacterized protein n=1 Tax=Acinetobacter celticus TaxID=1891224 RepID=A0A1C3CV60_9GAMM|nr:hypothetical protein [Acinetobacter celticus]ODA12608.1 hypothetical protein BBP83_08560 [Acinetobacter celticus]
MEFNELKEIGKRDIEILKNANQVKEEHQNISTQFLENAKNMVDRINFYLADLLSNSAGNNGLTSLDRNLRSWGIKNTGISLTFRVHDEASLSKMQTLSQIVVKRGRLQSEFNVLVTYKYSSNFEFAKQYESFSRHLNEIYIQDVVTLNNQIEKMKAVPNLISQNFRRTSIENSEFWMNFQGEKMVANKENFEIIIKKMFDLSYCLK